MKLSCILFLIPSEMYSGLDGIITVLEGNIFFCEQYFIAGGSDIDPEHADVLNGILNEYEISAVVYPSSTSYIINFDFYGWQEKIEGKRYIDRFLDFFTKKGLHLISMQMSATGPFDDTLGFFNSDESIARLILKEIKANEKLDA